MQDISAVAVGALLFSASMNMFFLPADIVLGGMTGIATVLCRFIPMPIGTVIFLLNLPLIYFNRKSSPKGFVNRTIIGIITTSAAVDLIRIFPITTTDPLICSVFGGITMGLSLGILLSRGYTTGGSDLIALLIKKKLKKMSSGTLIAITDAAIIILSSLFIKSFDGIFYSAISLYVTGWLIDLVISGSRRAELAFIITDRPEPITQAITLKMKRGTTIIEATGGFTGNRRWVVMCAVSKNELFKLKEIASDADKGAFVIIGQASAVLGDGFESKAL